MSHDKIASTFDGWAESGAGARLEEGHGDVVAQVIDQLDIRPGFTILDLGCGTGWATRILAQKSPGAQAIGIDVSTVMIAEAEQSSSLRIRARYEAGRFEQLDFADGKFDLVFSMEALYYSPDLAKALSEIFRVLKAGRRAEIVIDCYRERPMTQSWSGAIGLELQFLGEEEWRTAFLEAGFSKVECRRVIDRRGPGEAKDFKPDECFPDWESTRAFSAAGSLWISAEKA